MAEYAGPCLIERHVSFVVVFVMEFHVAEHGLELMTLLFLPPKFWYYVCVPYCLAGLVLTV